MPQTANMDCSEFLSPNLPWGESAYRNEIIGSSQSFKLVLQRVHTVAPTPFTVLIEGETGTGKEVIAQAIHNGSPRRNGSFVKLNCAAIPAGLLESELFGHDRGAFTGAVSTHLGRFQLADGGTLFLDEIGELPLELQPKLLRVLQDQMVEKLGSTRTIRVNVRIVAATNQNLARMMEERRFRPDLYYRLNVFPITLPPLRDRADDIPALVEHFVQKFSDETGRRIETIPPEVMNILKLYDWPGNIRELENVIKRAVITSTGPTLRPQFGELNRLPGQTSSAAKRTLAEAQKDHIVEVLRDTRWVLGGDNGAAARLGIPRTTLVYKMRKLGIARERGSKSFRGRLSGLLDLPAETHSNLQKSPIDGADGTIDRAFSQVGTA
ncbi:MAG TPA: sigma 54-interacting transcriptional regulator [Terriglobia bacterium]|nr:sigma 54-interacting transcriptional regulator [Terriglobia bacterium]